MKIKKMKIKEYGCIDDKEIYFGDRISVIKGNNESGKSTTHQAILAMLFGYKNTGTRKRFLLTPKAKPFSGGYPTIESQCEDSAGEYTLTRSFESGDPVLSVTRGGVTTKSENKPLDVFKGISRDTYEGIYSLDIDQIVKLKESWEKEQDSILAGLLPDFLLPNEEIMNNLDNKIKSAWKGKKVNNISKDTDDAISELKSQMAQAKKDQDELRQLEQEEEETSANAVECSESIKELSQKKIETARQIEFYREYQEIQDNLAINSQIEKYKDIPKDTRNYLKGLAEGTESGKQRTQTIERKIAELKGVVSKYAEEKENLELCKVVVPEAENIVNNISIIKNRAVRDGENEKEKRNKIESFVKRRLTNRFNWEDFSDIMKVDVAESSALWEAISKLNAEKAKASQRALENRTTKPTDFLKNLDRNDYLLFAGAFVGLLLMLLNLGVNRIITLILGFILFGGSIAFWILKRPKGEAVQDDEFTREIKRLDEEIWEKTETLKGKLGFDFIPSEKRNNPDEALIENIAQLQDDYAEYLRINKDVIADMEDVEKKERQLKEMAIEVLGRSFNYESDAREMREKLNELLKLEGDAKTAKGEINLLEEQVLEIKNRIYSDEKQIESIVEKLFPLEGDNIMQKAENLNQMRESFISAQSRMEIQRQKYPDYEELIDAIEKSTEIRLFDLESEMKMVDEKLEEQKELLQEINRKKGELKEKIDNLKSTGLMPAVIDAKLKDMQEERKNRIRTRDEYVLCYGIIQKARDRFVSECSPIFLEKAGEYLAMITDGKYSQIRLNDKGTSIMVMDGEFRVYDFDEIDATMSRGTKEQIYFALRLAMLERFDPEGEKLPIVLDEALVNWDVERFSKLMKIVEEISRERQVFMFTCHDYIVDIVSNVNENTAVINI
ncbi:MAG: AAA family ATPase [Eubacteriales bacterium]